MITANRLVITRELCAFRVAKRLMEDELRAIDNIPTSEP